MKIVRLWRWPLVMIGLLVLAACGGASGGAGDAVAGAKLFNGDTLIADGNAPSCTGCHPIQPEELGTIGPNLGNIGNRAATTVPDQTAEDYLRTSIVDGDAYLAGGYQEGIHYRGYGEALSADQISDLVAYMLTLQNGWDE